MAIIETNHAHRLYVVKAYEVKGGQGYFHCDRDGDALLTGDKNRAAELDGDFMAFVVEGLRSKNVVDFTGDLYASRRVLGKLYLCETVPCKDNVIHLIGDFRNVKINRHARTNSSTD